MSTSPKSLILFDEESMFINFLRTAARILPAGLAELESRVATIAA